MDTSFLTQLKKPSTLLGNHDTICGSYLSLKTSQISARVTLRLFVMNTAAFPLMSEGAFCGGRVMGMLAGELSQGRFGELKINYSTCLCRKEEEGGLARYVCNERGLAGEARNCQQCSDE